MQVGQFTSFTLSVDGAAVAAAVDAGLMVLDPVDAEERVPGGDVADARDVLEATVFEVPDPASVVGGLSVVERPVVTGDGLSAELDRAARPLDGPARLPDRTGSSGSATFDDNGASCGTVTTTVAPARAAPTAETADDTMDDADDAAVDEEPAVDVAMVHPARPTPSMPMRIILSAAFRRRWSAGRTIMARSYTRSDCGPGKRGGHAGVRNRPVYRAERCRSTAGTRVARDSSRIRTDRGER